MEKKIILITGASGSIGKSIVQEFMKQDVILILQYFTTEIAIEAENVFKYKCDLRSNSEIEKMCDSILQNFSKLDVIINNAGISKSSVSWKTSLEDWSETIQVNLTAPFYLTAKLIPLMKKNNFGRIINISSVVAQVGAFGTSAYAASKSGLLGLSKTLSKELANSGITVNAVALGYFEVGMIQDVPIEMRDTIVNQIPLKKLGSTAAITETINFLINEKTSYLTGQTINLNGGLYS